MTDTGDHHAVTPLRWPADIVLTMPGSKSEANRLLVAAALCGSTVRITGATPSDDVQHLVRGLATLGHHAVFVDEASGRIEVGPRGAEPPTSGELFCGNAGTALRFLVSVAAVTPGEWTLTGDAAMQRRPIAPLVMAWRQLGVHVTDTHGCPPVHVHGATPRGGRVQLDASQSSQFVSSLLLVGAGLPEGIDVHWQGTLASAAYVDLTCRALRRLGVDATCTAAHAAVRPGFGAAPAELAVAGDWSAMGVWTCLDHLTGSRVHAANLPADSGQADERLAVVLATLRGDGERTVDVAALPDQFPNLAVVAAHRRGSTHLTGAANLRRKESDRIAVIARELTRLGVPVEEHADGLTVHGGRRAHKAVIDPAADHRIAMAFALAGLLAPAITVADPGCVTKSYPAFWHDLEAVQRSLRCVAIVGMRGAGKSSFAASLGQATGLGCFDTDRIFEQRHGPIVAFVATHGWPAFRVLEAELVAEAVRPGRIVATGGGAIEAAATQRLLAERAIVLWLDADAALLRRRLVADQRARPSVTGAPVLDEIDALLARRRPLFARAATHRLDASRSVVEHVAATLDLLRPRDSGA